MSFLSFQDDIGARAAKLKVYAQRCNAHAAFSKTFFLCPSYFYTSPSWPPKMLSLILAYCNIKYDKTDMNVHTVWYIIIKEHRWATPTII